MKGLYRRGIEAWQAASGAPWRWLAGRTGKQWLRDGAFLLALAALGALSAAAVWSGRAPAFEVFGNLQGHIVVLCAALAAVALILRARAWAVLAGIVLAVNLVTIGVRLSPVTACPVQTAATGPQAVRVLTHNIWKGNRNAAAIEALLLRERPDIAVLQEVRPHHRALLERLEAQYPYQSVCGMNADCGIVVLSRYPLETLDTVDGGGNDLMAMETVVTLGDRKLVLLGAHLRSPFAGWVQTAAFGNLTRVVSRLPSNTIIVGDFNSVPWSANMSRYLGAAGICASNTTRATWPQWLGPFGIPIDNVFLKPGVRLLSISTLGGTGSDHKAILATIGIP
jgi:endonuclease/exonuclease/phosphatase (EEP) superfamily protein YafD